MQVGESGFVHPLVLPFFLYTPFILHRGVYLRMEKYAILVSYSEMTNDFVLKRYYFEASSIWPGDLVA